MIQFTGQKEKELVGREVYYNGELCIVDRVGTFYLHLRSPKNSRHGTRVYILTVEEANEHIRVLK